MSTGGSQLAGQYVEFTTKGLEVVQSAMDVIKAGLVTVEGATVQVNDAIKSTFEGMASRLTSAKGEALALAAAVSSGAYAAFAGTMRGLNAELANLKAPEATLDSMAAQLSAAHAEATGLAAALSSGAYKQFAGQMAVANSELAKLKTQAAAIEKSAAWDAQVKQLGTFGAYLELAKGKLAGVLQNLGQIGASTGAGLAGASIAVAGLNQQLTATPVAIGMAVAGFQALTNAARGWVNAGLAGTGHGNLMQAQFTLLAQQIAGVFVPVINMVTRAVTDLAAWFRRLTGDQQDVIRRFIEAAAVMAFVHLGLGRLVGMVVSFATAFVGSIIAAAGSIVTTMVPAIGALVSAMVSGAGIAAAAWGVATAGISVLLGIASAIVSVLFSVGLAGATVGAGILVGTSAGRSALGELMEALRPVAAAFRAVFTQLSTAFAPILEQLGGRLGAAMQTFAGVLVGLFTRAAPLIAAVGVALSTIGDAIVGMVESVSGSVAELGGPLLSVFAAVVPMVATLVAWGVRVVAWIVQAGTAVAGWLASWVTVRGVLATVGGVLAGIVGIIVGALMPYIVAAAAIVATIVPMVVAIGAAVAAVGYVIGRIIDALSEVVKTVFAIGVAVAQVATAIGGFLLSAIAGLFGGLGDIGDTFDGWMTTLREIGHYISTGMVSAVNSLIQVLARAARSLADMASVIDLVLGTNLAERLNRLADRLAGIRVQIGGPAAPSAQVAATAGRPRDDVAQAGGNFEAAEAMFRRINEAAGRTSAEAEQRERDQERNRLLREIRDRAPGQAPRPVVTQEAAQNAAYAADLAEYLASQG